MDGLPVRPLDTGQGKEKSQSRHEKHDQPADSCADDGRRSVDSSGIEAPETAEVYAGERRSSGGSRSYESGGDISTPGLDAADRNWDNTVEKRKRTAEHAACRVEKSRKRSAGDGERRRSSESGGGSQRAVLEPDSGLESRSEGVRSSFESDSSVRSVDYSRRSVESDRISRRSLESPDSHTHRPVFSPPQGPLQPAQSPPDKQPEPAHSRQGVKKKRTPPRATSISSSLPEQNEPTDLALNHGGKRDNAASSPRGRSNSGNRRDLDSFSRRNYPEDGRGEAFKSPKTSYFSSSSSHAPTSTTFTSAQVSLHRQTPSPPQGPSSSTSPISPLPDSSPYSDLPRLPERHTQHKHQRQPPYWEDPTWRPPSSRSYSPSQAGNFSASSSTSTSPPGVSRRLGEATLLRHLKSSTGVPPQESHDPLGTRPSSDDRDTRDAARGRRLSDESRSPTFSPLDARMESSSSKLSWQLLKEEEEKEPLTSSQPKKSLPLHLQQASNPSHTGSLHDGDPARPEYKTYTPLQQAQWKTERDFSAGADHNQGSGTGNQVSGVVQSKGGPLDGPVGSDNEEEDEDRDGLPSTVIATTAGVPSPAPHSKHQVLTYIALNRWPSPKPFHHTLSIPLIRVETLSVSWLHTRSLTHSCIIYTPSRPAMPPSWPTQSYLRKLPQTSF
ncbi:hypothetical protein ElyMa_003148200 [Elysia marginata]|uniref:Uncharacterized protein n=1 Tax=Elysia marginata TaxID=1093978 RepID=A0AAV4IUK0_9GAST|nr:hypothetical protein ElyMa_003148200 [Elysia marginata]